MPPISYRCPSPASTNLRQWWLLSRSPKTNENANKESSCKCRLAHCYDRMLTPESRQICHYILTLPSIEYLHRKRETTIKSIFFSIFHFQNTLERALNTVFGPKKTVWWPKNRNTMKIFRVWLLIVWMRPSWIFCGLHPIARSHTLCWSLTCD